MKSVPVRFYVGSALAAVTIGLLLSLTAYTTGYFLLQDERGLFSARWMFDVYQPAIYLERWVTCQSVDSGYVDEHGMRYAKSLPAPTRR
jgi:hypothetical protein